MTAYLTRTGDTHDQVANGAWPIRCTDGSGVFHHQLSATRERALKGKWSETGFSCRYIESLHHPMVEGHLFEGIDVVSATSDRLQP